MKDKIKDYIMYLKIILWLKIMDKYEDNIMINYRKVFNICKVAKAILDKVDDIAYEIIGTQFMLNIIQENEKTFRMEFYSESPITERTTYDVCTLFTRDVYVVMIDGLDDPIPWYNYGEEPVQLTKVTLANLYRRLYMILLLGKANLLGINIREMLSEDEIVYECNQL